MSWITVLERLPLLLIVLFAAGALQAATVRVDVNAMPTVVFTGDSQTCGRVGAMDYPQMLSWELPVRVINTAVGGTNTTHLLDETRSGTLSATAGEMKVSGTKVSWGSGPYPGQKLYFGGNEYTIDRIEVIDHAQSLCNLWLKEPVAADFSGEDYTIEAGWRTRVAMWQPDYTVYMYTVNDARRTSDDFTAQLEEIARRTLELGAYPFFLSGYPAMDGAAGGTHPSLNLRNIERAEDLARFTAAHGFPFGDVLRTVLLLDEPLTCVWTDTIHPTTDGSITAINALRHLFAAAGLYDNPWYVQGYRLRGPKLDDPSPENLLPLATSQPDYTVNGVQDDNNFNLEAVAVRNAHDRLASADGIFLTSEVPVVLKFGVGPIEALEAAHCEAVVNGETKVAVYDWEQGAWTPLTGGTGNLQASLDAASLQHHVRDGALWLAFTPNTATLELDYAAVIVEGDVAPWPFPRPAEYLSWPPEEYLAWDETGNLAPNGTFAAGDEHPAGWEPTGLQVRWIQGGIVAQGNGDFATDAHGRFRLFRAAGADFTGAVRPLDFLEIEDGPENCTGRFIISSIVDDEILHLRRFAAEEATGLDYTVVRTSGNNIVPGNAMVQCVGADGWLSRTVTLEPGRYRLGVFFRAYAPERMHAHTRLGPVARIAVVDAAGAEICAVNEAAGSFQWQRVWCEFTVTSTVHARIALDAVGDMPTEFTGITLHPLR